jgi:hypothetical protein
MKKLKMKDGSELSLLKMKQKIFLQGTKVIFNNHHRS